MVMTNLSMYFSLPNLSTITESPISLTHFFAACALIFTFLFYHLRSSSVYLVDFACYLPPESLRAPFAHFIEAMELSNLFDSECTDFQTKVLAKSGVGDDACVPIGTHEIPPNGALKLSQEETEEVLFTIIEHLLSKHNINPKSIDILVSNCSVFCPSPSISTMVINKFGFRSNIKSISLSGMGCGAGIMSISLAKDLLKVHKNSLALVLSMEAVTTEGYTGSTKSMLIANTIFRMGGAAILLSNKHQDKKNAKYKLQHLIRTHMGSDDQSYSSIYLQEDEDDKLGVSISRALLPVAGNAIRTNVSQLGPIVLPYSEQLQYVWSVIRRKFWTMAGQLEIYVPNFRKAFEHFCIHAGGKSIIQAVENNLRLNKEDSEAARMTLYRFGNTSSSTLWYELCYLEAKGKVKKGDRVWQIAFGSGFKANSAVWKCISNLDPQIRNAWSDIIHLYPVDVPNMIRASD